MVFVSISAAIALALTCQEAAAFGAPSSPFSRAAAGSVAAPRHRRAAPARPPRRLRPRSPPLCGAAEDPEDADLQSEVSSLRVAALKQELESYGISTRAFLEKGELVEAVVRARREGQTPDGTASSSSGPAASAAPAGGAGAGPTAAPAADRTARLQIELEKCRPLTVAQLREELASYGISSATFFEKSEFVRAVAEARADGAPAARKSKKKKRRAAADEVDEVTAAKVEVVTGDEGPRSKKAWSADAGAALPSVAAGAAYGMDMCNIADMLKSMGGMGGAGGGNPFGSAAGAAGNPFGGAA